MHLLKYTNGFDAPKAPKCFHAAFDKRTRMKLVSSVEEGLSNHVLSAAAVYVWTELKGIKAADSFPRGRYFT